MLMRLIKWRTRLALCAAFFFAVPVWGADSPLGLPDTAGEWSSAREDVTPLVLEAGNEDVGRWTCRVYVNAASRHTVEANLMEGSGPGPLRVPKAPGSCDAVFSSKSEYHILEVAGCRAVLERHPLLPLALAVSLGENRTLTLEGHVEEEELTTLAAGLIAALNNVRN